MKNFALSFRFFSFILFLIFIGCQQKETVQIAGAPTLPAITYNYKDLNVPNGTTTSNLVQKINNEEATLGRVLFYDSHLSKNNSTSCGSCHEQHKAFADGKQFSEGLNGRTTSRNSMSIANAYFQNRYFWDMRADNLEEQVMMPIENHIEMGIENLESLPEKLASLEYYPALFNMAFGTETITEDRISKALAGFLKSMISLNSKYDQGIETDFANFSLKEKLGMELFIGKARCNSCHGGKILSGWSARNIGLDLNYEDEGVANGAFKVPSLKNIALTGPYMHDGRFNTLLEVVNHYNEGIKNHPNLSWHLKVNDEPLRLGLTDLEKEALVAFLETLTDEDYLTDLRFSNPF